MVSHEPTRTGTGMARPRLFAAIRSATAWASNASAPIPYTVSVGSTTSWPDCTVRAAVAMAESRTSGSAQSYVTLTGDLLGTSEFEASGESSAPIRDRDVVLSRRHRLAVNSHIGRRAV